MYLILFIIHQNKFHRKFIELYEINQNGILMNVELHLNINVENVTALNRSSFQPSKFFLLCSVNQQIVHH